jgi:anti-sigma regulatory factor (Ser/Thr protein kinase)
VIADEGPGFDISKLPDPTDLKYIDRPSGRGVLLMRAFMNKVRYNTTGNRVLLVKTRDRGGDHT